MHFLTMCLFKHQYLNNICPWTLRQAKASPNPQCCFWQTLQLNYPECPVWQKCYHAKAILWQSIIVPTKIAIREMLACWNAPQQLGIADDERLLQSANAWHRCRPKTTITCELWLSAHKSIKLALHVPFQERKFVYILKCFLCSNFCN